MRLLLLSLRIRILQILICPVGNGTTDHQNRVQTDAHAGGGVGAGGAGGGAGGVGGWLAGLEKHDVSRVFLSFSILLGILRW